MDELAAFFMLCVDAFPGRQPSVPGRQPVCTEHAILAEEGIDGELELFVEFTEECLGEHDDPDCDVAVLFNQCGLPEEANGIRVPGSYPLGIEFADEGDYWSGTAPVVNLVMEYPEELVE